jgi:hypothetical protein
MKVLVITLLVALLADNASLPSARCGALCSCNWERDPIRARDGSIVVIDGLALDSTFSALPLQRTGAYELFRVRVVVRRVWKGTVSDTIPVFTPDPSSACGFPFVARVRYILFLYRDKGGDLYATMCSLSQPLGTAADIVAQLGHPIR